MEDKILNTLSALSSGGRFKELIYLCDQLLLRAADSVMLRYCRGIALTQSGQLKEGLAYLNRIIDDYRQDSLRAALDFNTKKCIAHIALQLSLISEFACRADQEIPYLYSHRAATFARTIALEINDKNALAKADEILVNHIEYIHKAKDSTLPKQIYIHSNSPYILQVEPTNACNIACSMCPRLHLMKRPQGNMALDVFDQVLSTWGNKHSNLILNHIFFNHPIVYNRHGELRLHFMGEPLLHPHFDQLIRRGRANGALVVMQTNGVLLSDQLVRNKILESQPDVIGISIDGIDKETYEQVRRGSHFEQLVKALALLYQERSQAGLASKIKIETSTILADSSQESIQKAFHFIEQNLAKYVDKIGMVSLTRQGQGHFFDKSGALYAFDESQGYFSDAPLMKPSRIDIFCIEALLKLNVLWDGTIVACCYDVDGEHVLGRVDEGIDKIWQNESTRKFHLDLLNQEIDGYPLCKKCERSYACKNQEACT